MAKRKPKYIEIGPGDEIPLFQSEEDEHQFWATHTQSAARLEQAVNDPAFQEEMAALDALLPPSNRENLEVINIALDKDVIARLRAMGRAERTGSRTIIRRFIAEGLARIDAAATMAPPGDAAPAEEPAPAGRAG